MRIKSLCAALALGTGLLAQSVPGSITEYGPPQGDHPATPIIYPGLRLPRIGGQLNYYLQVRQLVTGVLLYPSLAVLELWGTAQTKVQGPTPPFLTTGSLGIGSFLNNMDLMVRTVAVAPNISAQNGSFLNNNIRIPFDPSLVGTTLQLQVAEVKQCTAPNYCPVYLTRGLSFTIGN